MANRKEHAHSVELPWWLAGGHACEFCFQEYSLSAEFYCIECDRPICPLCVTIVQETRQVVCPRCGTSSTTKTSTETP